MINLYINDYKVGDKVIHNGNETVIIAIYEFKDKLYRLADGITTSVGMIERSTYAK